MLPRLRHVSLRKVNVKLSSSLIINAETVLDLISISDWNCPLLEQLETIGTLVSNAEIKTICHKFPKLKSLSIWLNCGIEVEVFEFSNLETLSVLSKFDTPLKLHISALPKLTTVQIIGYIDELDFRSSPNLKCIYSCNIQHHAGMFNELLFYDQVPWLECLTVGNLRFVNHGFQEVDRNNNVHWEHVKN
jgi:hypothetical protein